MDVFSKVPHPILCSNFVGFCYLFIFAFVLSMCIATFCVQPPYFLGYILFFKFYLFSNMVSFLPDYCFVHQTPLVCCQLQ